MKTGTIIIEVYLDDGRVYSYNVTGADKAREHAAAIVKDGYRHNNGTVFEHYPPHRVLKVKVTGGEIDTKYPDTASGT
jgi:hypothetical protein